MDDRELLRAYVEHQSEAAFAGLVSRHVRMVYATALRQLREPQAAEDVAQAVFVLLARKAALVRDGGALPGWLYRATCHAALRARISEQRRRARETEAMKLADQQHDAQPVAWENLAPQLDEAMRALKRVEQDALVLRYFQNKSVRETAETLALSEAAAQKRVSRGLEKLRSYFARRGIVTTGALLGEVILANAAEAEPAGLAGRLQATSAAEIASVGWLAWMLRLILMITQEKTLIVASLVLLTGLVTLSWPKWAGPVRSGNSSSLGSAQKSSFGPLNGKAVVQAPQAAPVPASFADAVTTVTTQTATAATSQSQAGIPPAPPPPSKGIKILRPVEGMDGIGGRVGPVEIGVGGSNDPSLYLNLFLKLKFTPEQQEAFLKVLDDSKSQMSAVNQIARQNLSDEQLDAMLQSAAKQTRDEISQGSSPVGQGYSLGGAMTKINQRMSDQLGITAQLQTIKDTANAQLRQVLGSPDNIQAYQTYVSQSGVREWVTTVYGGVLQQTGAEALTPDRQEALVNIVANNLQPGDRSGLQELPRVVEQASAILTPDQIKVLQMGSMGRPGLLNYAWLHRAP